MKKAIEIRIGLSAPPMSATDFSKSFSTDPELLRLTENSFFYVIAQRPMLSFENIIVENGVFYFQIHKIGNSDYLEGAFPIYQEGIVEQGMSKLYLKFGSDNDEIKDSNGNLINVHSLKIYNGEPVAENFVKLITPEIILIWFFKGLVHCAIEGNITPFLNYKVHYIGTAPKQKIVHRLLSHSTLQKILSEVESITKVTPLPKEIVLLFFEIDGSSSYSFFHPNDTSPLDLEFFTGKKMPNDVEIFTEAEKIFIKCFKPEFNEIKFKSYPTKNDLMTTEDFIFMAYSIEDPLVLVFKDGKLNAINEDFIVVSVDNEPIVINFPIPKSDKN